MTEKTTYKSYRTEEYIIKEEPFYIPVGDEVELFEVAYSQQLPVLLKGPTGTGKTRFVEYMCYRLGRPLTKITKSQGDSKNPPRSIPLMTIACHEDLTASDLVGLVEPTLGDDDTAARLRPTRRTSTGLAELSNFGLSPLMNFLFKRWIS